MPATVFYQGQPVGIIQSLQEKDKALNVERLAFFIEKMESVLGYAFTPDHLELIQFDISLLDPTCPHGDSMKQYSNCKITSRENKAFNIFDKTILFERVDLAHGNPT